MRSRRVGVAPPFSYAALDPSGTQRTWLVSGLVAAPENTTSSVGLDGPAIAQSPCVTQMMRTILTLAFSNSTLVVLRPNSVGGAKRPLRLDVPSGTAFSSTLRK